MVWMRWIGIDRERDLEESRYAGKRGEVSEAHKGRRGEGAIGDKNSQQPVSYTKGMFLKGLA